VEHDPQPGSGSSLGTIAWGLAAIISASAFFLAAFFVTGEFLDDGVTAASDGSSVAVPGAPAAAGDPESATGDAAAASGETTTEAGASAGTPATIGAGGDFTTTELPEFDPEALIYGGAGADGAILAGPGIVPTSGFDRRTNWELIIPSAQLRAAIAQVVVTASNFLGAPDNPELIGWWEDGPAPGENGNVLLDGHRDFSDVNDNVGFGVCWLLTETRPGDPIILRDVTDGSAFVYTVREIHSVTWDDPTGSRFLRASEDAMLTIVTCEGSFDDESNNYSQRRVVVADLTDRVAPSGVVTAE